MSNIVPFRQSRQRQDAYANLVTGYGTNRSHASGFSYYEENRMEKHTLDALYAQHPIAWKIIDLLPDDALREGITINEDDGKDLKSMLKIAGLWTAYEEALKMARLHGGAAIYLQFEDDSGDPMTAQMPTAKRPLALNDCYVLESDYIQPEKQTRSRRHEHYVLYSDSGDLRPMRIHRSRLIVLHSFDVSRDWYYRRGGWPPSVLERCRHPLLAYSIAHGLVPEILKDFIRDVIKIDGMHELALNSDDNDLAAFNDRLDAMFLAESLINKTVLDTNDDFIRQSTSVNGLNDLIRNPEKWLCAAVNIPHTRLFGESPGASLSQSGSSQEKDWHKSVSAYQEKHIRPGIDRVLTQITGKDIQWVFNPLDVPSTKERAETTKILAEAAATLVNSGIITAYEAATMFENEELNPVPVIDMESREELEALPTPTESEIMNYGRSQEETSEKESSPQESGE